MERVRSIFLWAVVMLVSGPNVYSRFLPPTDVSRSDNFTLFEENGKVGLKDEDGRVMIPAIYEAIGWATGKLSIIDKVVGYKANGLWGLINTSNKVIAPPEFLHLQPGEGSFLIAQKRSSLSQRPSYGVITTSGRTVIPFNYDGLKLSNMRAVVMSRVGTKFLFGLVDLSHEILIPLEHQNIYSLGSLRFAVQNFENKTAIYTDAGTPVTGFTIDSISAFHRDYAIVYQQQRQGLINRNGQFVLQPTYGKIRVNDDGTISTKEIDIWYLLKGDNTILKKDLEADLLKPLSPHHYAMMSGGKLQLTDNSLKPLHSGFFSSITDFENGIALYKSAGMTGAITEEGKTLIPAVYRQLIIDRNFYIACLNTSHKNRWVILDATGHPITEKQYESIAPFNGQFYPVQNRGYWGAVDRYGREIITCVHDSLIQYKSNHVVVRFKEQYGVINLSENWIVTPQSHPLSLLDEEVYFHFAGKTTFLKALRGNIIYFSDNVLQYDSGRIIEHLPSGAYLTVDKSGVIAERSVQPVLADVIYPESEGFRAILKDGKFGFIDEAGRLRIANRYEAVQPFTEGRAAIRIMNKWGFIDRNEKLVVQPVYDRVENFRGSLSIVTQNGLSGLVDASGRIALPVRYDEILQAKHQRYVVRQGDLYGLVDPSGKLMIHPRYEMIEDTGTGYVIIRRDGKFGVLTLRGVSTIPMIYDGITYDPYHNQFLAVRQSPWKAFTPR